jgi:hypothetical protein
MFIYLYPGPAETPLFLFTRKNETKESLLSCRRQALELRLVVTERAH